MGNLKGEVMKVRSLQLLLVPLEAVWNLGGLMSRLDGMGWWWGTGRGKNISRAFVIGDSSGHVGLGIKASKEVATAIRAQAFCPSYPT